MGVGPIFVMSLEDVAKAINWEISDIEANGEEMSCLLGNGYPRLPICVYVGVCSCVVTASTKTDNFEENRTQREMLFRPGLDI